MASATKPILNHYLRSSSTGSITFIFNSAEEESLSYSRLLELSLQALKNLQVLGLKPGNELMLHLESQRDFVVSFWACVFGGFVAVPISTANRNDKGQRLEGIAATLKDCFLLTDVKMDSTPYLANDRVIFFDQVRADNGTGIEHTSAPDDLVLVQYSSGSTGTPKGVMLSHRNLIANALDIIACSKTTSADSSLCWMPLSHDMGLIGFHITSLIGGIDQYLIPTDLFIRRPLLWADKASQHRVTQLYSPNFGLKYFLSAANGTEQKRWDLSSVRIIYNGAEPISNQLVSEFHQKLAHYGLKSDCMLPVYGLAEASVAVTLCPVGRSVVTVDVKRPTILPGKKIELAENGSTHAVQFVSVGRSAPSCNVRIFHEQVLQGDHITGEVQIQGTNVTKGYYNNVDESAKVFTSDGWLKTGDLGFWHDGELVICGRKKSVIIVNGQNYYPHDLERVASKVPGVEIGKVAATSFTSPQGIERIAVFIINGKSSIDELTREVKNRIRLDVGLIIDYVIPARKFPKTTSGKIQYFKLREMAAEFAAIHQRTELADAAEDNTGTTADKLGSILINLFGLTLEENSSFAKNGLTSIQAFRFAAEVGRMFHIDLSVVDLLKHDSVRSLAHLIDHKVGTPSEGPNIQPLAIAPATLQQRRFWLLNALDNLRPLLAVGCVIEISGDLDLQILNRALLTLVERHESLRTHFVFTGGEVQQVISRHIDAHIEHVILPSNVTARGADDLIAQLRQPQFNLEHGPLFNVGVFSGPQNSYLIVRLHHIISDGWSISVFVNELFDLYEKYKNGRSGKNLPNNLAFQYKDYAHWISKRPIENHRSFWLKELERAPENIRIPFSEQLESQDQLQIDSLDFVIPSDVSPLRQMAGAKLSTTVIALVKILIHKFTGVEDLVTGVLSLGRLPIAMNQIGCYVNVLPIRTAFTPASSFEDIVTQVSTKLSEAMHHELYSYEMLLNELNIEQGTRQGNLFNVAVSVNDLRDFVNQPSSSGLSFERITEINSGAFTDLHFAFYPGEPTHLRVFYNASVYTKNNIQALYATLLNLASSVIDKERCCVSDMALLDPMSEKEILKWSKGEIDHAIPQDVLACIEAYASSIPTKIAIVSGDMRISYVQLAKQVELIASFLTSRYGSTDSHKFAVLIPRSYQYIISILAILRCRATFIPIDPETPEYRIQKILKDSAPSAVLVDKFGTLSFSLKDIDVIEFEQALAEATPIDIGVNANDASRDAYVMYTSGTTGTPKGIAISRNSLNDYVRTFTEYFRIHGRDTFVNQSSTAFDTSLEEIFPILCSGGTLAIASAGGRDIAALLSLMHKEKVTCLSTTPRIVAELNKHDLSGLPLRLLISGGERLEPSFITEFPKCIEIFNTYGPTESTVCATYHKIEKRSDASILGKPIKNREIYILNQMAEILPEGVIGEIHIAGAGLSSGYVNANNEAFVRHLFDANKRMFRTGDLGYWRKDGSVVFCGRKDDQIKVNGYRVELAEIEQHILGYPGVTAATVIARGENEHRQLVGYYTSGTVKDIELEDYLRTRLPFYMVPSFLIKLSSLPTTSSGKISRKDLPPVEVVKDNVPTTVSPLEKRLSAIWAQVLALNSVDHTRSFFQMGGNSIKAVQILNLVNREFDSSLDLPVFFRNPTVKGLTAALGEGKAPSALIIKSVDASDSYELSPSQKGLWLLDQLDGTFAYNIFGAFELVGPYSHALFTSVFEECVSRHEILRTVFITDDEGPKQRILTFESLFVEIPYIDANAELNGSDAINTLIERTRKFVFQLDKWPLISLKVIKIDDHNHVFLISIHHIIADGISMNVLASNILNLYKSRADATDEKLATLPIQYKDYAYSLNELLRTNDFSEEKRYWTKKMHNAGDRKELPIDFKRPPVKHYNGSCIEFFVDEEQELLIEGIMRQEGVTFYTFFLSILKCTLHKWTNNSDIIVGGPVSLRNNSLLDEQVGCYVNTLLLRTTINEKESFRTFLHRMKGEVLHSYKNSIYPFENIVADLSEKRHVSRNALFDIRFIVDEGEIQTRRFEKPVFITDELTIRQLPTPTFCSIVDLTFFVSRAENILCRLEFNSDLFRIESIENLGNLMRKILAAVIVSPEICITELKGLIEPALPKLHQTLDLNEAF